MLALGLKKTARLVDVDFVPLIDEHYDIVLLKNAGNEAFIATVRAILEDPVYRQEIRAMGGYDVSQMGTVVFETI